MAYISLSSDFALYLEDYLLDICHNWDIGSMWCKNYLIKCMWVSDLHFMVQWFCLISWRLFGFTGDTDSVWHKRWMETIYVGQWPIFNGPVILPYTCILKTIWGTNVIIGILDPCDAKIYQLKCMWVSDLHFLVQWFCLISWRLLDGLMLYWRYWFTVTQTLNWNYICRSVTYISWSIYVGQLPIFHGPYM